VVDFYWRPGCGWSTALERALVRQGVELRKHDISTDLDAAAFVRAHADGNETVPTVRVGELTMVNPSAAEVTAALAAADVPAAMAAAEVTAAPADDPSYRRTAARPSHSRVSRLVTRVLGA
jgi:mycoredoxin